MISLVYFYTHYILRIQLRIKFLLTIALFYCFDTEINRLLYEDCAFLFPNAEHNVKFKEQAMQFLEHKQFIQTSYSATSTQVLLVSPFPSFSFSFSSVQGRRAIAVGTSQLPSRGVH